MLCYSTYWFLQPGLEAHHCKTQTCLNFMTMHHYKCEVSWEQVASDLNSLNVPSCDTQKRFRNVEEINLEFAQDVEDKHLTAIASKV